MAADSEYVYSLRSRNIRMNIIKAFKIRCQLPIILETAFDVVIGNVLVAVEMDSVVIVVMIVVAFSSKIYKMVGNMN